MPAMLDHRPIITQPVSLICLVRIFRRNATHWSLLFFRRNATHWSLLWLFRSSFHVDSRYILPD